MPERVFNSAGVRAREIDLSQPTEASIVGVPAGIIGTSERGPAFVPVTFGSSNQFIKTFGAVSGDHFGSIAVNEWLNSGATACTYLRVLGVGDGKERNTDGSVTNAGFVVGSEIPQSNGVVGQNPFANKGVGDIKGRTYFLGCFMSESNGSTIFSDAGIQKNVSPVAASLTITSTGSPNNGQAFTLISGAGTSVTLTLTADGTDATGGGGSASNIHFARNGSSTHSLAELKALIEAHPTLSIDFSVGAVAGSSTKTLTITQVGAGKEGNTTVTNNLNTYSMNGESAGSDGTFSGGIRPNHAVPILRGVLLAPSGVIIHLSSSNGADNSAKPVVTETARSTHDLHGRKGSTTGSYHMGDKTFTMLLNGFKGSTERPKTHITASFDPTSPVYFNSPGYLNDDPTKIEEHGHLLLAGFDIYEQIAAVTGSGVLPVGFSSDGDPTTGAKFSEDIAFLLTSSIGREATSYGDVPRYEDFQDRFSHAESPFVISQKFGGKVYDLFKFVAVDAGETANKYKISIDNIKPAINDQNFGSFVVRFRGIENLDTELSSLEPAFSVDLDPSSQSYIAREIGDENIFFDFDNDTKSQKIVVDGNHPRQSDLFRVVLSDDLVAGNVPKDAIPMGFRGPSHLVTSGTMLSPVVDGRFSSTGLHQRVVEPPIPYRNHIKIADATVDSDFYWGIQSTHKIKPVLSNATSTGLENNPLSPFLKYFPDHAADTTKFKVGGNAGVAKVNGSELDSDLFNFNKFSLENIKVRTGSNNLDGADLAADTEFWHSASYIRNGNISKNDENKTRALRPADLKVVLNRAYAKFSLPVQGGFNGTNIFDIDKSKLGNNATKREMDDSTAQGGTSGPTVAAYRKAIDILGSKTDTDIQLLAIPDQRNAAITDFAISAVENRFDALYIMDIEERDEFNAVVTSSADQSVSPTFTTNAFKNRNLDTSFAAAYFPNVQLELSNGSSTLVPPSIAALSALAQNDSQAHPWIAPAGTTRGILPRVLQLGTSFANGTLVDNLYEADINPIVNYQGYGHVVWGQKTLLQNQSSLDRINVRRLLIDVRRKVRNVANTLLFEPNRQETLEKFTRLVTPILADVKAGRGVNRFKVIIDSSTTTQADIENNTIRGKVFLEPTAAAEFISLDFVVTNAGATI